MKISLDFELEYDVADVEQLKKVEHEIEWAALEAIAANPGVKLTKTTKRVAGFYPDAPAYP